jgi:hypothetical protein
MKRLIEKDYLKEKLILKERGIIKCAQEKNKTVLMNFLTVLMDL